MSEHPDIASERLDGGAYADNFDADMRPPLDHKQALIEAARCYFCHDAPCVEACPTGIDIPNFIRGITTGNLKGAAKVILEANIFGGICARVCPVEELCEEACVRNAEGHKPVTIGLLQRHATDHVFENGYKLFERGPNSGRTVAIVGAGPAGLSCAHRLAMLGHASVVFEARDKIGGLNEYGIATYKVPGGFAQREAEAVVAIGGVETRAGQALGRDVTLADLRRDHDGVFIAAGLAGVNALRADGADMDGVENAVDFIARLRQTPDLASIPIGRRVVVVGGGNTAIDAATQAKRLGAEDVTLVYRRGPEQMSATAHERDWAQTNGVSIRHWSQPRRLIGHNGHVREIEFEYTQLDAAGRLAGAGDFYALLVDQVFSAIGQILIADPLTKGAAESLDIAGGKIAVNADRRTSLPDVWAGGDCASTGVDLTVSAVEDGKVAAHAIDRALRAAAA